MSPALSWWKLPFLSHFHHELLESWETRLIKADLIRLPDALTPPEYLPVVFVAHALEERARHARSLPLRSHPTCACRYRGAYGGHGGRPPGHSRASQRWLTQARDVGRRGPCGPRSTSGVGYPPRREQAALCPDAQSWKPSNSRLSWVCIISFLLLSANLSLAVLVVPVALLVLLALVFYFLSVLGAACFLSGFIQI